MTFENTNIIIGIFVLVGIGFLFYIYSAKPVHNEGVVHSADNLPDNLDVNSLMEKLNSEELQAHTNIPNEEEINPTIADKLRWKNQATTGRVASSYKDGVRGNAHTDEWDEFYKKNSELVDQSYIQNNDKFLPIDETKGNLAGYSGRGHSKQSPDDLFKIDKLLPQEVKSDWFEVMPEPIKVKNRHLVNVTRPVGVNTIGSSRKNASYDIRGSPPCPMFVVSPWLQSSITPDLNIKGLN